jgi:hypothetical protein
MSDGPFYLRTQGRIFDRVRDTVSKLPRVDAAVLMLAFAGVVTLAWIGFLLWAAFKLLTWSFT